MTKFSSCSWLSLLSAVAVSSLSIPSFVSQPAIAAKTHSKLEPSAQASPKNSPDPFYQQARADLEGKLGSIGTDYYAIYRIVERIARANGLDEQPWRIRVSSRDVLNASASNLNLLTFEGGLLEQLHGDTAAIACVVGHEMAHHTESHIAESVELSAQLETLQVEALKEARAEVESANRQAGIFGAVVGVVADTVGIRVARSRSIYTAWMARDITNSVLRGLNAEQTDEATARAAEIYEARVAEIEAERSVSNKAHESEADEVGYQYVVRAGFEPAGCARAMGVLERAATSRLPGLSHPKPADRLAALTALNTPAINQPLIAQGNANLNRSPKPLEYGIGRDGASLRVESRFGSQDIDDGFPQ